MKSFGKIDYHCDRLDEFKMFEPPAEVAEEPTEKDDRWFWSRRFPYCCIALFSILFCIFIVTINESTSQTPPSTPSPSSEPEWSKNGPIYVINVAPLLSPVGKLYQLVVSIILCRYLLISNAYCNILISNNFRWTLSNSWYYR